MSQVHEELSIFVKFQKTNVNDSTYLLDKCYCWVAEEKNFPFWNDSVAGIGTVIMIQFAVE